MRLVNLLKAIAISPVLIALWLLQKAIFWVALRIVDVRLLLSPCDVEWMPREQLAEKQQQVSKSHQQMMDAIAASLR